MSYGFKVTCTDKATAKDAVRFEMSKVVASQRVHTRDAEPAIAAAHAFIDMLTDAPAQDVEVQVHGSLSGSWDTNGDWRECGGATCSVSAYHMRRKVEEVVPVVAPLAAVEPDPAPHGTPAVGPLHDTIEG